MSYSQLITPNPDIPCTPGYCLQYVRETFGLAGVHPSATAGWNASPTQHPDLNFPAGCWVPVWFGMAGEPLGHVVLMAPDGSIYSTSDNSTMPHHHPSLADLLNYYAYYGLPLTYRGWTEDIEDVPVIAPTSTINLESATITPITEEIDVTAEENIKARLDEIVAWTDGQFREIRATAESNRNALAEFVRDVVNAKETVTPEQIDAKLAALTAPRPAPSWLVKGDVGETVYAWDGGSGFRGLTYAEYDALVSSGAAVRLPDWSQAKLDAALGAAK